MNDENLERLEKLQERIESLIEQVGVLKRLAEKAIKNAENWRTLAEESEEHYKQRIYERDWTIGVN
jgi:hypothetical protein